MMASNTPSSLPLKPSDGQSALAGLDRGDVFDQIHETTGYVGVTPSQSPLILQGFGETFGGVEVLEELPELGKRP